MAHGVCPPLGTTYGRSRRRASGKRARYADSGAGSAPRRRLRERSTRYAAPITIAAATA